MGEDRVISGTRYMAWDSVQHLADRLLPYFDLDREAAGDAAYIINVGQDREAAHEVCNEVMAAGMKALDSTPGAAPRDYRGLKMFVDRLLQHHQTMSTIAEPYILISGMVPPGYGKTQVTFNEYVERFGLGEILDPAYGQELNLIAPKGHGKTHTELLLGEAWPGRVIHNIPGVKDKRSPEKWVRVSYLSEVLSVLLKSTGTTWLILVDEPSQTLKTKAGSSPAIESWNKFRDLIRKLNACLVMGWQHEKQIPPLMREDSSIGRAEKPDRGSLVLTYQRGLRTATHHLTQVPPLESVEFDTEAWTQLVIDVDMEKLTSATAGKESPESLRSALRRALESPKNYLSGYGPNLMDRYAVARDEVVSDPPKYQNAKGAWDQKKVWNVLGEKKAPSGLPWKMCGDLVRELNKGEEEGSGGAVDEEE